MKRLCSILARGGSKGVVNKNIRDFLGKPLIAHSLLQAKESELFDKIAVSSDSEEILKISKEWGADLLIRRPQEMASDTAPKLPAIRHAALEAEKMSGTSFDTFVDLDATSPLRTVQDIREAVKLLETKRVSNVITGTRARRSPYFNLVELDPKGFARLSKSLPVPIVRRQDSPRCFDMNASVYVWARKTLLESKTLFNADTLLYEMPEERSLDIDTELDLELAHFLARRAGHSRRTGP